MKYDCCYRWSEASTARDKPLRIATLVANLALEMMVITFCFAGLLVAADESTGDHRYSPAKRSRLVAARRPRRIIFVDDNYGLSHKGCDTPEGFLKPRLRPLLGTQVDAITYCVYAHSPAHVSRLRPKIYHGHGGPADTDGEWTRNHRALLKAGKCPLQLVIDFAHGNGMEAFAHMSMNDCHDSIMPRVMHPFKKQHPDLVIETENSLPDLQLYKTAYDFAHAEVRDRQYVIIEEVCQRYDVDGFEMDFIRHPMFFSRCLRGEPATQEETQIMTSFMARIRKCADQAATRRGRPLLLSARVPDNFQLAKHLGMDVKTWIADDLVDILIAGGGYAPNSLSVKDFIQVAHEYDVLVYPCINQKPWSCAAKWRQEGNRALAATWHQAGADGIHFWNLATPFDPYNVKSQDELTATRRKCYACLNEVGDPRTLVANDKLYCVDGTVFVHYKHVSNSPPLPRNLRPGETCKLPLVLADDIESAARSGSLEELRLEMELQGPVRKDLLTLKVNQRRISDYRIEPVQNANMTFRLTASLGFASVWRGKNELEVSRRVHTQDAANPLQLFKAQLWVKFK